MLAEQVVASVGSASHCETSVLVSERTDIHNQSCKEQKNGSRRKNHRHRPGHHQLGGRHHGRFRSNRDPKSRRQSLDAQRRRVHRKRRDPGRRPGSTSGRDQPHSHDLFGQAIHGPSALGSGIGREDGPLRRGRQRRQLRQDPNRRQRIHAARNQRQGFDQAKGSG
jgi:hypothetical protein